ncbi:adenosine-specific kinase [Desulfovibrio ferrophilus]|uniref:Transmembrane protein n=1 Tax=Desulfovibrio ferrophilus TaxID=241368 RepID=A0A2Z6AUA0_9BACT|nr:adenosine-specific kinase [Desulfovibrio ferrophilus]BBD06807.1 transmembrane protein [Desulfovibrio ferrophilus]
MELSTVKIENPDALNLIFGQSHFIKTVEDLHEAIVGAVPFAKFGLAFCEASDKCLIRLSGTDEGCIELASRNAQALSCGHSFILFMKDMFPINIVNVVQNVPEVVRLFCATANPVEVVVAETDLGRGVMGVIDGFASRGVETEADVEHRKGFLRTIGYKL